MSVVINTNYAASLASYNLSKTHQDNQRSLNRLSSGSRINSSMDDAAGLAVSMKMDSQIRNLDALDKNLGNAKSFLETQDGALRIVAKILQRIEELEALKKDVTKNGGDIALYDTEIAQLEDEFTNIRESTFNGVRLFSPDILSDSISSSTYVLDNSEIDIIRPPLPSKLSNAASPEVVLLIDTSGSMVGSKINSVASNIQSLVQSLVSNSSVDNFSLKIIGYHNSGQAFIQSTANTFNINKNTNVNTISLDISNEISNLPNLPDTPLSTVTGNGQGETLVESLEHVVDNVWQNKNISNLKIITFTDEPPTDTGSGKLDAIANKIISNDKISLDIFRDSVCDQVLEIPFDPLMTDLINKSGATAYELDTSLPSLGGIFSSIGGSASSQFVEVNLDLVAQYIAQNGATQSAVNTAIDRTKTNVLNLSSAKSRILDVDVAQESTQLARTKVLLEAGTAMLAQANQSTQSILRLISLN